ncbi:integration host factor, actinobacterial type [Tsukamurella tyrosinosolvens]|uniref:integration host factor, actinobacterial type n=1 Tax=Tsukamurella tyrosinosolvens TaxID=57704 RepID=UPI002DD43FF9|nr:integration host factor, actinobacterial type [Tsukamurella tyrosinosolvens]MEC4612879.1 integration host factor, actinobacterial type [Tsukamurella tyrosinosolvens]
MALPTLTPEQRADALAKAAAVRAARAAIKNQLKTGATTLAAVLDRADEPAVGKMRVASLLEALPKIGKVKAAEIMTELEIAENRRVAGLGERQRTALVEKFAA